MFRLILSHADRTKSEPLLKTFWSMRSYGTTLLPHRLGLKLEPIIGGHWESQEEFDEMKRKHLGPFAKEIMELFKRLEGEHE